MASITYRPEIDGLRAVAVGTVVLFHAQLGIFSGGFIGVDVFFVISGFLITSIIARELDAGTFSLISFYERRIRRIFPALLLVIASCLIFGAWRMTPDDYDKLGEAALAAIGFHSNFYFADKAGYFMPSAETLPLLHTWSLGVEEQFYVVAPVLLLLLWRSKTWLAPTFALLVAAALVASLWGMAHNAETAFYLPHTRAIELMIGMALGLGLVPAIRPHLLRHLLAGLGLVLIAASALLYTNGTPFPGAAALIPCIGTAMIIHCTGGPNGNGPVGSLLSTAPMTWLGRISYSLYLWHWPLFAFAEYEGIEIGIGTGLFLVAVSVLLADLTYRWVEQPARNSRQILTRARVYAAGLGSAGLLASAAGAVATTDGWPGRLPRDVAAFEAKAIGHGSGVPSCQTKRTGGACQFGDPRGPVQVLVWGDSHGHALLPQFDEVGKQLGIAILMVENGGCLPLFQSEDGPFLGRRRCRSAPRIVSELLAKGSIRHVVIAARWGIYSGRPDGEVRGNKKPVPLPPAVVASIERSLASSLQQTVSRLQDAGLRVTLIGPVPELPVHLPSAMLKAYMRGKSFQLSYDFEKFTARQTLIMRLLAASEASPRVDVIYPDRILCPDGKCAFIKDGLPIYRDEDHLNLAGGNLLIPSIAQSLSWLKRTKVTQN